MNYKKRSLEVHKKSRGKLEVVSKISIANKDDLSIVYTPGVAEVSRHINEHPESAKEMLATKNMVAVITDGSAVLGLGNIGPEASLPVMEGKSALFKEFAGIDSFPIALDTQDTEEIIKTIKIIAPTFGGINLEDIAAPRCFEIEERLKEELDIPVFHDDQHGTAIVVLAGLINALKVTGRDIRTVHIVINGAGAAGVAIAKLLNEAQARHITVCDSQGIISEDREGLNPIKEELISFTNQKNISGSLQDALKDADIFIGVSKGNLITAKEVTTMAKDPVIFAMANPDPEILPTEAAKGGAAIVATGRSDFPNQLNNVLVFPGIFKGALEAEAKKITDDMKIAAAKALAALVKNPSKEKIIPSPFDKGVANTIAQAVVKTHT